ncbi:MAG: nuclear transport factor 2 family protein, partial [Acidimicrobiales bacterium]
MDDEVRRVIDRTEIRELTARYNRCFDDGDSEGFAATFTDDGVMEVTGGFT